MIVNSRDYNLKDVISMPVVTRII